MFIFFSFHKFKIVFVSDCFTVETTHGKFKLLSVLNSHPVISIRVLGVGFLKAFICAFTDGPKDTSPEDALEKTYVPSLKTLEEEVMEKMGIQEHRRHQRSYWY